MKGNIFESNYDNLATLFNINNYRTTQDRLIWEIDLNQTYKQLKSFAKKNYTLLTRPESEHDRIVAKITVTPHIMQGFETLKERIHNEYDEFANDYSVQSLVSKNRQASQNFKNRCAELENAFISKIENLRKAWHEDWKYYGRLESYATDLVRINRMSPTAAITLMNNMQLLFDKLYKNSPGDESTNPLKYWIMNTVRSSLDSYKNITPDENTGHYNRDSFNMMTIKPTMEQFLLDIDNLPNHSLHAAYNKIEEIMNYVNIFCDINYDVNIADIKPFKKRIKYLKIVPGYDISPKYIYEKLCAIYDKFKEDLQKSSCDIRYQRYRDKELKV